jgi:RimJ/RimL family protein N-acetyltransferase
MLGVAARAGFTAEGTLRRASWANGRFVDEAVLGLLASEWSAAQPDLA